VVSAVASTEKETILVSFVKRQLESVWEDIAGEDALQKEIDKEQFSMILESLDACRALEEAGVDPIGLVDNIDFIFGADDEDEDGHVKEKTMSFGDFVALVLTLRGSNSATVKDIVDLRKYLNSSINRMREELRRSRGGAPDSKLSMVGRGISNRGKWGMAANAALHKAKGQPRSADGPAPQPSPPPKPKPLPQQQQQQQEQQQQQQQQQFRIFLSRAGAPWA